MRRRRAVGAETPVFPTAASTSPSKKVIGKDIEPDGGDFGATQERRPEVTEVPASFYRFRSKRGGEQSSRSDRSHKRKPRLLDFSGHRGSFAVVLVDLASPRRPPRWEPVRALHVCLAVSALSTRSLVGASQSAAQRRSTEKEEEDPEKARAGRSEPRSKGRSPQTLLSQAES